MTAFNEVTVTGQWTDGASYGEGNYLFAAQGSLMDSSSVAIVTPVIIGQLSPTGQLWNGVTDGSGITFLASDNFLPGQVMWHFLVRVKGQQDIDVANVVINFSDGPSQGIFGVLESNGWTATSS